MWQGIFLLESAFSDNCLSFTVFVVVQPSVCGCIHELLCASLQWPASQTLAAAPWFGYTVGYSTHEVTPRRWNIAAQVAEEFKTVICITIIRLLQYKYCILSICNMSLKKWMYYLHEKRNTEDEV